MRCYASSMLLSRLAIIAVCKTFLPARFLRSLPFLRIWRTPQNAVRMQTFWTMDPKKGRGHIFLSLGGLEKKYLSSVSGTQICNVIKDIFCQLSFLNEPHEIVIDLRGSANFSLRDFSNTTKTSR